jgi:DNA polymerase I-like protein with 3'-5' exonuclease and polymerase domains
MVGVLTDQGVEQHFPFDHCDVPNQQDYYERVQWFLDEATILICHNAAYDLMWLWESGFKYDGPVFDTMLAEYVLQRGIKEPLSLQACAERYELDTKKQDTLKEYFAKGYSTRDIPYNELCEYLSADLHATQQLSDKLIYRLNTESDAGLRGMDAKLNQKWIGQPRLTHTWTAKSLTVFSILIQSVCIVRLQSSAALAVALG